MNTDFRQIIFLPRGRREYLRRREEAREYVHAVLGRLADRYGRRWNRIAIKNLCRNWGSCSQLGNLNFNYKIVHLPSRLAEYVVFHEVCHLDAFNHSRRFWALVEREYPDHRELRQQLRGYCP